jgi:hypothetical protein
VARGREVLAGAAWMPDSSGWTSSGREEDAWGAAVSDFLVRVAGRAGSPVGKDKIAAGRVGIFGSGMSAYLLVLES